MAGEQLWSWNYRRASRFLKARLPYAPEPMAVSPTCDRVAMAGDPAYRYVWVAGRDIEAQAFQTVGTPLAVAFNVTGDYLAVSTGAYRGYLLTRALEPHWTGHLRDFPIRWPEQRLPTPERTGLVSYGYSEACEPSRDGVTPLCLPGPNGLVITSRGNEIRAVRP